MSFAALGASSRAAGILQRSLERGRIGHAYLLEGESIEPLEATARALAQSLNCENPPRRSADGRGVDACDTCSSCRRIADDAHPDVHWVRPESRSRVITIDQVRELIEEINLKSGSALCKVGVIAGADRLNPQAANAFLKTLEEPPAASMFILLATEPDRLLDTIRSRCLRLHLSGSATVAGPLLEWVTMFATAAAGTAAGSLLARYRLLGFVLDRLVAIKREVEEALEARSPLGRLDDLEPRARDRLEAELAAAIEAEYRRRRGELLGVLEIWLRDVWVCCLDAGSETLRLPELRAQSVALAARLDPIRATANFETIERTQRQLYSNVQEALSLEVGFLRLHL